ncbi:MAG: tyrosine-type recombinase/integrase [Candidatus Nanohaloarchaea archaeon]
MSQTPDIHDQEQRLNWNQKKFSNSEYVCDPNKELVKQFCDKCFAEGLSDARVKKYITNFHTIFKLSEGIDFVLDEADREILEKVVARIERSDYAEATKSDFKACLKKYYKVMEGEGFQYPDKVKFFSQTRDSSKIEKPDPLSKKQIMRILDETQNDRDLALYHLLYEGALRPQEILSLSISDLSWTSQGVRVNVNGKTGNRQILVVECKDHLLDYPIYRFLRYLFLLQIQLELLDLRYRQLLQRSGTFRLDLLPLPVLRVLPEFLFPEFSQVFSVFDFASRQHLVGSTSRLCL